MGLYLSKGWFLAMKIYFWLRRGLSLTLMVTVWILVLNVLFHCISFFGLVKQDYIIKIKSTNLSREVFPCIQKGNPKEQNNIEIGTSIPTHTKFNNQQDFWEDNQSSKNGPYPLPFELLWISLSETMPWKSNQFVMKTLLKLLNMGYFPNKAMFKYLSLDGFSHVGARV